MLNVNFLINQMFISLFIILSVAFYTLLERKVLSYQQNRKGPNKISPMGIIQPMSDALKLLTKKELKLTFSNNILYWIPPFYSFMMFILILNLMPSKLSMTEMELSILIFLCIIALSGFSTIIMGWASNSKFTMMGSLRSLAQSISYEVLLILSVLIFLLMMSNFSMALMQKEKFMIMTMIWLMAILLATSLICEVNRAPFDLSEGESELVSGFNTEYGMTKFSLIFLSEYGLMIFMSLFMCLMMNNLFEIVFFMKTMLMMILFLWSRSSYPRVRYDTLMYFTWKNLLPLLILMSIFYIIIL